MIVTLGLIPTTEYATPGQRGGRDGDPRPIKHHDAIILQRHGSVTVGASVWDAYLKLEKLENAAEVTYKLLTLGQELPFPPGAVDKLIDTREKHGLLRPGERGAIRDACSLCSLTGTCPRDTGKARPGAAGPLFAPARCLWYNYLIIEPAPIV